MKWLGFWWLHQNSNRFFTLTRVIYCYILFIKEGGNMNIIINNLSMRPIYEQIVNQMKASIMKGELKPEQMLPSVRGLAKDLRVS